MKAKQIVRRLLKKYSQKESPILAITGDHGNNIAVPNRTGYIYARLPNGDVVQVYNSIAPLALDIDITIGFNPKDPNLLQVTSIIGARGRYGSGDVQKVGPLSHHKSHEWMANSGATDVVFSELRQFMPFRPTPEGGMSLHVNRGVAWINDAWQHTSGSSIDFAPYVTDMVSGTAQYALAYLDSSGVPDFVIGSGNLTTMSALTLDDIPDHYPGTVPIAAIKLRGNQTGIVEAKSYTDLIDLRFPFRHDHPFTDLDDVPHNYSGQVGKAVVVNDSEDGLDFVSVVTGSGGIVGASDVTVDDSGGHYTGTNVEDALQEIGAGTTLDSRYVEITGDTMTGALVVAPTTASALTIGAGTAGVDYALTFNGETNDGVLTWMEDEDYFKFSDDVVFADTAGLYYGHIYSNSTIAVTITGTATAFEVGDTFTTGEMNGCAFGSAHYIDVGANGAGKYLVEWDMSTAQNTPAAAIEMEGGVMIDGVAQAGGRGHRTVANSSDTGSMSGHTILDLAASKQVSLFIINETNATNIDVEHANLTITMIGGT